MMNRSNKAMDLQCNCQKSMHTHAHEGKNAKIVSRLFPVFVSRDIFSRNGKNLANTHETTVETDGGTKFVLSFSFHTIPMKVEPIGISVFCMRNYGSRRVYIWTWLRQIPKEGRWVGLVEWSWLRYFSFPAQKGPRLTSNLRLLVLYCGSNKRVFAAPLLANIIMNLDIYIVFRLDYMIKCSAC